MLGVCENYWIENSLPQDGPVVLIIAHNVIHVHTYFLCPFILYSEVVCEDAIIIECLHYLACCSKFFEFHAICQREHPRVRVFGKQSGSVPCPHHSFPAI